MRRDAHVAKKTTINGTHIKSTIEQPIMNGTHILNCMIYSDVHLEQYKRWSDLDQRLMQAPPSGVDTLILAGDIGVPINFDKSENEKYVEFLKYMKTGYKHVILIAGNHEYYNCVEADISKDCVDEIIQKIAEKVGVVFLQRSTWLHPSGVLIAGCTLWSKVERDTQPTINDTRFAFSTVRKYQNCHSEDVKWLTKTIETLDPKVPVLVVTHHMPSHSATHSHYAGSPYAPWFASDLDHLFVSPIIGWVAGHTHERMSCKINNIPLEINPLGYPQEVKQTSPCFSPFTFGVCTEDSPSATQPDDVQTSVVVEQ